MSCLADIFYEQAGEYELRTGEISCVNGIFLVPTCSNGAIALTIYTVVCYSYAFVMLFVFYYLPKKSGLVLDAITGDFSHSVLHGENMTKSLLE